MTKKPLDEIRECVRVLKTESTFCLDLETTGLNPREDRIRGVAIGTEKKPWYFHTVGNDAIPLVLLKDELSPILLDREKVCVMHNGKFDLKFLATNNWVCNCKIGDSMVLAFLMDDNRSGTGRLSLKGKGGLVDELFDVVLETWGQSELAGGLFGKPEDEYAKADVEYTMKCWKKLTRQLSGYPDIRKFFWEVAMPTVRILADIENAGMRVDVDYLHRYEQVVTGEASSLEARILDAVGKPINVGSTEQLSRFLFEDPDGPKLKPKPWMKPGKNKLYSTAESVMSLYSQESPICQMILDWRAKNKLVSTYVSPFLRLANSNQEHRIYCSLLQCGTKTGRLASREPNLQNIPQYKGGEWGMRKAFVAPSGKKLIVADYCVVGGTQVITEQGIKPIEYVVERRPSVLSSADGRQVCFKKVEAGAPVGVMDVFRISLEDGSSVKCTADHTWMMLDGRMRKTSDLSVDDRLAHVREGRAGRYKTWYMKSNRDYVYQHRLLAGYLFGEIPEGFHVDHIDGDHSRNVSDNLRLLEGSINYGQGARRWWDKASEEDRTRKKRSLITGIKNNGRSYKGRGNPNYGKRRGNLGTCPTCGKEFYSYPSQKKIYCGRSCYTTEERSVARSQHNHRITKIEYVGKELVYQITVADTHTYVLVNGLVSGNSQLELRLMAHRSQDKTMLEIYQSGGDIHQNTMDALGLGKEDRTVAKGLNFGLLYGLSAKGFKDNLWNTVRIAKTLEECQQWRYGFFKTYPGITLYHERVERYLREHGYTKTLAGRRRRVKEDMDRDFAYAFRMALNCTIQGSAADIVLIAMRNFDKILRKFREKDRRWDEAKMLLQVHDEIIVEAPEEIVEEVSVVLKDEMEGATTLRVPLVVDPGIAESWADAK